MKTKPKMHTLKWFLNRIGKGIYRDDNKCPCIGCAYVLKKGLTIGDKAHAEYLYMTQNEYANLKIFLNYRDKKEL
jgi:hypothetical protein